MVPLETNCAWACDKLWMDGVPVSVNESFQTQVFGLEHTVSFECGSMVWFKGHTETLWIHFGLRSTLALGINISSFPLQFS